MATAALPAKEGPLLKKATHAMLSLLWRSRHVVFTQAGRIEVYASADKASARGAHAFDRRHVAHRADEVDVRRDGRWE